MAFYDYEWPYREFQTTQRPTPPSNSHLLNYPSHDHVDDNVHYGFYENQMPNHFHSGSMSYGNCFYGSDEGIQHQQFFHPTQIEEKPSLEDLLQEYILESRLKSFFRTELERLDCIEVRVEENEAALRRINVQLSQIVDTIKALHEQNFFDTMEVGRSKVRYIDSEDELEIYESNQEMVCEIEKENNPNFEKEFQVIDLEAEKLNLILFPENSLTFDPYFPYPHEPCMHDFDFDFSSFSFYSPYNKNNKNSYFSGAHEKEMSLLDMVGYIDSSKKGPKKVEDFYVP